jgi:hypothetical protein
VTLRPGIVVIDATFLKSLKRADAIPRIEASLRAAHLEMAPSVPNVLEALKHTNPTIRRELLAALRRWVRQRPLTPWPLDLLRHAGEALPNSEFVIPLSQMDWLIEHPDELEADHSKAVDFLDKLQTAFARAHESNRPEFQQTLKATGQKYAWPDIPSFLVSSEWSSDENQRHLVEMVWDLVGLPAPAPSLDIVRRSEVWRVALDAFGATVHILAVRANRLANPPGFVDLMQLTYLCEHRRARIFITDDGSLYDVATEILRGRYENVRVMRGQEFLDNAV